MSGNPFVSMAQGLGNFAERHVFQPAKQNIAFQVLGDRHPDAQRAQYLARALGDHPAASPRPSAQREQERSPVGRPVGVQPGRQFDSTGGPSTGRPAWGTPPMGRPARPTSSEAPRRPMQGPGVREHLNL